jgi:hypothetical protein
MINHTYLKIQLECDIHGTYEADPIQADKGNKVLCPVCNPAEKRHKAKPIAKVYERINQLFPEERQLKASDLPTIRGELLDAQDGICPLCNKMLNKPVVDHWHAKGNKGNSKVRLCICAGCNSLVGVIENHLPRYLVDYSDTSTWLNNLAEYLTSGTTNLIHPTERPKIKLNKTEFKALSEFVKDTYNKVIKYPLKGLLTIKQEEYYTQFKEYKVINVQ